MCPRLTDTTENKFCCGLDNCCDNHNMSVINDGLESEKNKSPWLAGIATVYLIFVFLLIGKSSIRLRYWC